LTELKVYLSSSLSDRFRRVAMSVFGYGRGSLSKAAEDAFSKWCEQHEQTIASPTVPNSAQTRSDSTETKTISIDPDERPGTVISTTTSGNASVKSAS
jgi:hypothetical protein